MCNTRGEVEDQADRNDEDEEDLDGGTGGKTEKKSGDESIQTLLEAVVAVGKDQRIERSPKVL